MMNLRKYSNPYLKELKPRKFFPDVKESSNSKSRTRDIRKYNPDWVKERKMRA